MRKSETAGQVVLKRLRNLGGHRKLALAAGAVGLVWGTPGWGDSGWQVGTGNWFAGANWSNGVPSTGAIAYIDNGGIAQITNSHSMATPSIVDLGLNSGDTGTLQISAGTLTVRQSVFVGASGTGTFVQSGGIVSLTGNNEFDLDNQQNDLEIGLNANSVGSYQLSAGTLAVATSGNLIIGEAGNGTFIQSGGNISDPSIILLGHVNGATGSYSLLAGTITASSVQVSDNGSGVFTQTGGALNVGFLAVSERSSSSGTYNLQGGTVAAVSESIGFGIAGTAAFMQSGGINQAGTLSLFGLLRPQNEYTLSAGSLVVGTVELIGYNTSTSLFGEGTASFLQSGGINQAANLVVGGGTPAVVAGAFTLTGGTVAVAQTATIGSNQITGTFTQSGGLFTATNLVVNSGGSFSQNGGVANFDPVTNGGAVTVGTAGNVIITGSYTQTAGQTVVNGLMTFRGGATFNGGTLQIGSNAQVDITDSTLAINYGSPGNDPVATIAGELATGYSGGTWTGTGIVSSTAAGGAPVLSVGYADGNLDAGTPAGPNQLLVMVVKTGDANLDGVVDIKDVNMVAANYGLSSGARWAQGDFDYDGDVDRDELNLLLANYSLPANGEMVFADPALLADSAAVSLLQSDGFTVGALPEPGSAGVLVLAAGVLAARRRKKIQFRHGSTELAEVRWKSDAHR